MLTFPRFRWDMFVDSVTRYRSLHHIYFTNTKANKMVSLLRFTRFLHEPNYDHNIIRTSQLCDLQRFERNGTIALKHLNTSVCTTLPAVPKSPEKSITRKRSISPCIFFLQFSIRSHSNKTFKYFGFKVQPESKQR